MLRGRSFTCRDFLQWRRSPLTPPTRGLPSLPQRGGNVGPIKMGLPGGRILECASLLELLTPAGEQLCTLLLAERIVLEQIGLLVVIAGPFQAQTGRVAEKPPRLRAPAAARP